MSTSYEENDISSGSSPKGQQSPSVCIHVGSLPCGKLDPKPLLKYP